MTDQQELIVWIAVLRPFALVVILGALYPVKFLIQRKMKDGKLKRLLLLRLNR
jgi:hypothetical protein